MSFQRRKSSGIVTFLLASLHIPIAFSGSMGETPVASKYFVTLEGGVSWQSGDKYQIIFLAPEIEEAYIPNSSDNGIAHGDVFFGITRSLSPTFQGRFGLALAAAGSARPAGTILDNAEEQYDNYTYANKLQHSHVALKGQLLANMGWVVTPWVSASAGVGFNRAYDYSNVTTIFAARADNNFQPNTETAFTWTLGAGIQKALNSNWEIGVGYEFADWGKSSFNRAVNQTAGNGLALNHLYTNGIQFNITWLA